MNSVQNYNYSASGQIANGLAGSGPIDTDPAFIKLVDAAWFSIQEFGNDPTDATTMAMMNNVNALNIYFQSHTPGPNDPLAQAILNDLNATLYPGTTLAQACINTSPNFAANIQYFENNTTAVSKFYYDLNNVGNSFSNQNDSTTAQDMQYLDSEIQLYNWYMNQAHPDPKQLNSILENIAYDVNKFNSDSASDTDGYIVAFRNFINTPLSSAPGSPTLQELCANVVSGGSNPSSDALNALSTALKGLGEASGNGGGELRAYLEHAISYEKFLN